MIDSIIRYGLLSCSLILIGLLKRSYSRHRKRLREIEEITDKLSDILKEDTDEKIMVFTDDKVLMRHMAQLNRLLEDRQRLKVDYRRSETALKHMLSNVSHDIKTPLTVILGYLEIMVRNKKGDEPMLIKIWNKAKQVMELINQFFTLSKIDGGDMEIILTRINIPEFIRENVIDFYRILTEQEFTVAMEIPETDVFVQGNEDALSRIFSNLISNAIRYGSDGRYLGLRLRSGESFVWMDIIDHGRGIDPSIAAHVFDRLYTAEDSRNAKYGGSGLGLAIAKSLAEKLGGDIVFESEPGVKTVFSVKLKKAPY